MATLFVEALHPPAYKLEAIHSNSQVSEQYRTHCAAMIPEFWASRSFPVVSLRVRMTTERVMPAANLGCGFDAEEFHELFEVGADFHEFGFGGGQGGYANPFAGADVMLDLDYCHLVHGLVFQHQHRAFV